MRLVFPAAYTKETFPGVEVYAYVYVYAFMKYHDTNTHTQHAHATVCLLHAAISACVYYLAAHYTYIIHKAKHRAVPHA